MSNQESCLFCNIIAGTIPSTRVFENEHILAFLDINPIAPGHVLVMPKKHYPTLIDLPDTECAPLMQAIRAVGKAVQKTTHADGFNVVQNNGKAAGQLIFHLHFHIIPRFTDDTLPEWHGAPYPDPESMQTVATAIAHEITIR